MNLSPIVSKTIPEFVNDDYPLFVQFLKTYYKWLDITQINSIENVVDIDTTLDSFVKYFRKELDVFGIKYQYVDERIYLKYVKQFFLAKGSEAAYWFLFRILFNSDSAIIRPWDSVFIPSNAKWVQDITIFVKVDKGDGNNFKQNKVIIIGEDKKEYQGRVIDAIEIRYNIFELFLDTVLTGNITVGNIVISEDKQIKGRLLSTVTKIVVQSPGRNFNIGEMYDITTNNGYGSKFIVRDVDENGGITKLDLISFGLGYEHEFMQTIYPITKDERIVPYSNIAMLKSSDSEVLYSNDSSGTFNIIESNTQYRLPFSQFYFAEDYGEPGFSNVTEDITPIAIREQFDILRLFNPISFRFDSGDNVSGFSDFGEIVKHNYSADAINYFNDLTYVGNKVGQFSDKLVSEKEVYDAATIFCYTNYMVKYPGYYSDLYDTLGQNIYIQDSYYYQIYSYVTSVDQPFKSYHNLIDNIIHPIGNKVFGNYVPTNNANLSLSIENTLDIIYPGSLFLEPIIVLDNLIFDFSYNILSENSAVATDEYLLIINGLATLPINYVNVTEEYSKTITKYIDDTFEPVEKFDYIRVYKDVALVDDPIAFDYAKRTNDNYALTDSYSVIRTISISITEELIIADGTDSTGNIVTDENLNNGNLVIEEGINIYDTGLVTDSIPIMGNIIRINETLNLIESTNLYYGELYVNQSPPYWDVTYYENERNL